MSLERADDEFARFSFILPFPCIFASLFVPLFPLIVNKW